MCDICEKEESVGVYGTIVPLSIAYCRTCMDKGAQPDYLLSMSDEYTQSAIKRFEDKITFYINGEYLNYVQALAATKNRDKRDHD